MASASIKDYGRHGNLVGYIGKPVMNRTRMGFVFFNAGFVNCLGPNRIYVELSQMLNEHGFWTLRFDSTAIGESGKTQDYREYNESILEDGEDSLKMFAESTEVENLIFLGMCSGCEVAVLLAEKEPKVCGLVLVNPTQGHKIRSISWKMAKMDWLLSGFLRNPISLLIILAKSIGRNPKTARIADNADDVARTKGVSSLINLSLRRHCIFTLMKPLRYTPESDNGFGRPTTVDSIYSDHVFTLVEDQEALQKKVLKAVLRMRRNFELTDQGAIGSKEAVSVLNGMFRE